MSAFLTPEAIQKSTVIPHMASPACRPDEATTDGHFTLIHAGGLLPKRKVDSLFQGIQRFLREQPDCPILFKSIGPNNRLLAKIAKQYGVHHLCEFIDEIWYDDCQAILRAADVLLIIEADMEEGIFLPSKLADYVQAGRPILAIAPKPGTLNDLLGIYGGGLCASNLSPEEVCAALITLYAAWKSRTLMRDFGSSRLLKFCSERVVVESYLEIFTQLVAKTRSARASRLEARV